LGCYTTKEDMTAFIFPGQGAQYTGMGRDFIEAYPIAKETIEEAEDLLGRKLRNLIFDGSESDLTETQNSQVAIYVISIAILRTIEKLFPNLRPNVCAGLSLGEYTALTAAKYIEFSTCLPIVQLRGLYMSDACEAVQGTMAVVLGLNGDIVEQMVLDLNLPNDLWTANFNCPGQVVVSGTKKGIDRATEKAKEIGAKRVLPLSVHGAFHSGLMKEAEERLAKQLMQLSLEIGDTQIVMNVPGDYVTDKDMMKQNLIKQVTQPVRWEQGIRAMQKNGIMKFIEIGCGNTLAGMNKRIGVVGDTISVEKVDDLKKLERSE